MGQTFTARELQLLEWACRREVEGAKQEAARQPNPSTRDIFTEKADGYAALAEKCRAAKVEAGG